MPRIFELIHQVIIGREVGVFVDSGADVNVPHSTKLLKRLHNTFNKHQCRSDDNRAVVLA